MLLYVAFKLEVKNDITWIVCMPLTTLKTATGICSQSSPTFCSWSQQHKMVVGYSMQFHTLKWTCLATLLLQPALHEVEPTSTSHNSCSNKKHCEIFILWHVTLSNDLCNLCCNGTTRLWDKLQGKLPSVTIL